MHRVLVFSSAAASLLALFPLVSAQGTNATCGTSFSWMNNARGQNPCLVAAYLNAPCIPDPADSFVFSLPTDFHYRPPSNATASACQCSSPFYSVLQACAVCQNESSVPWSTWITNCTQVFSTVFPDAIPDGTSVPAWAYLDVTTEDNFNQTTAFNLEQSHPQDSTASPTPPATSSPSASNSSASIPVPTSNSGSIPVSTSNSGGIPVSTSNSGGIPVSTSNSASIPVSTSNSPGDSNSPTSSHKSNTGAIAGGVVGGVIGVAIIAGLLYWWSMMRRRNTTTPATPTSDTPITDEPEKNNQPDMGLYAGSPLLQTQSYVPTFMGSPPPQSPMTATPRIYDPNDPSTFPTATPGPETSMYGSAISSALSPVHSQQGYQQGPPGSATPGRYNGIPEL